MDAIYKPFFPNLSDVANKKTSNATPTYNCIAWAFKDITRVWWPAPRGYWPLPIANISVVQAFDALFAVGGWQETDSAEVEEDFEKIALFTKNGVPTHAARLLPDGNWTSKLGWNTRLSIDLSHGLNELDGGEYGAISKIYKKAIIPDATAS